MFNQLKLNKTYSSLKMVCLLLHKELLLMKEKNDHLIQKANKLELTILSIIQRMVTKEEMKQIIKEGVSPIINILIGKKKEIIHKQTQTHKAVTNKIKQINTIIHSQLLDTDTSKDISIYSLIETGDKRICKMGIYLYHHMT